MTGQFRGLQNFTFPGPTGLGVVIGGKIDQTTHRAISGTYLHNVKWSN